MKNIKAVVHPGETSSLESLGISSDTFSTLLSPVILKSLPTDLVFEFNKEFGDKYSISNLIDFLNKQLIAKERTELVKDSQNIQSQTHRDNNPSWQRANRNELKYNCERVATANELFVYDSTSMSETCVFCENCHPSAQCGDAITDDRSCLYEKNSNEIHLLIGADYAGKLLTGKMKHLSGGLVAEHTLLGWTVMEGHPPLPANKELAQKRLKNTVKSLKLANRLNECQEVFNQWEREGIIEPIHGENDIPENLDVHYLPHRAVFKYNSTTKVRPVFDGSAKMRNFVSINECIEKCPNLISK
ncbi:integrase catalytic domain-containing protein [Trichonephila clavipes]|nr:integrase catalytic domain-containing protein [Trichonephila clavipes]